MAAPRRVYRYDDGTGALDTRCRLKFKIAQLRNRMNSGNIDKREIDDAGERSDRLQLGTA